MKQLKHYFNDFLETYKHSRAEWYNRCKSDINFYYEEMDIYAKSPAYLEVVSRHNRIGNVEDMPETTKKRDGA